MPGIFFAEVFSRAFTCSVAFMKAANCHIPRRATMKAVILAGGLGTRISEETHLKPKPMIEIGGKPILWHIMKIYGAHGINNFIICLGYKGYLIKEYFANYHLHMADITFDLENNNVTEHQSSAEPWMVTLVDTGEDTMTGGRLKRVADYLGDDDFCFTYGDGVGDIDIDKLIQFHKERNSIATVTTVRPPGRYGTLSLNKDKIVQFEEKPKNGNTWINGGFFVLSPRVLDYIQGDETIWEREPLETLANEGKLYSWLHNGFWHPMDTLRDKNYLENLWNSGNAPWKVWK
jgi:glucose-1-phosphate cytidylyltransferase